MVICAVLATALGYCRYASEVESSVPLRRLISTIFVAVLFALAPAAGAAALAAPYPPPTAEGSGSVSQSRVEAGGCVTFSGTGFEPNTAVVIRDNGKFYGTVRTDSQGSFTTQVCFDASAKRGKHTLTGTGAAEGGGALTVTAVVFITGVSQRPGDGDGGGGDGDGGGIPFTGFAGTGIAVGGIALLGIGSGLLIASERRHRERRRAAQRQPA